MFVQVVNFSILRLFEGDAARFLGRLRRLTGTQAPRGPRTAGARLLDRISRHMRDLERLIRRRTAAIPDLSIAATACPHYQSAFHAVAATPTRS